MADITLPDPTQIEGAPHPRETMALFGQAAAEHAFLTAYNAGRLHSGWLITGPQGVGKATLAYRIATFLLAEQPPDGGLFGAPPPPVRLDIPLDHSDARLVRAGSHPRLFVLKRGANTAGDKLSQVISVDQARELKKFFQLSATDGGRRVVIIDSADELNPNAANAILKVLEEPPARTTLLLISHRPTGLLPTIRSRCRELRCATLTSADLDLALTGAGLHSSSTDALATLAAGSTGTAIRLQQHDGLALYAELVHLFSALPRMDRTLALKLSDACAGRGAEARFSLTLDLIDIFLARAARAGLMGEPSIQGAPNEARLLARLSPNDHAARRWATLQSDISTRARAGRAVNLDPAALILDMLFAIEATARKAAAA